MTLRLPCPPASVGRKRARCRGRACRHYDPRAVWIRYRVAPNPRARTEPHRPVGVPRTWRWTPWFPADPKHPAGWEEPEALAREAAGPANWCRACRRGEARP